MKAVASANDVHTHVNMRPSAQKLRRLPIRLYFFEEGLYIIKAKEAYQQLLGKRVISINGYSIEELSNKLKEVLAGSNSYLRYESAYFLSSSDFLHGMGIITDPESVKLKLRDENGETDTMSLSPEPMGPKIYGYESWRELSPVYRHTKDTVFMVHIRDTIKIPLFLTSPDTSCMHRYLKEKSMHYVQINQNLNHNCKLSNFTKTLKREFAEHPAKSVIVDLRFNTGGNLLLTSKLVKGIPKWHKGNGKIFIITGGPTFSAGIVTAARLKYYAGEKAVIVGEEAAEGLKFWAETRYLKLPNSEILIFAGQAFHNWETKDYEKDKKHFWLMKLIGVPAGNIEVDIPATMKFKDYIKGKDSVLEKITEYSN
jgi:hypothetical protein